MTTALIQWEGQIVNDEFHLQKYLGGSEQSAVFLTKYPGRESAQAAIKLIPADAANAERQLHRWGLAEKLSHPHLIRILRTGRCHLGSVAQIFVVMEYEEENLGQILSERPLTAEETREMLEPTLDALAYLHGQGLVHGHLQPANVMANQDQLKLSSDGVCNAGEPFPPGKRSAYDPPEAASGTASPAGDVWSLGMTLTEVLTQRLPSFKAEQGDPVLPQDLPPLFLDIVRGCLRRDPQHRWTIAEIAARLHSPVHSPRPAPKAPQRPPVQPPRPVSQEKKPLALLEKFAKRRFVVPGVITLAIVVAIIVGLALRRQPQARQDTAATSTQQKPAAQQSARPSPRNPNSNKMAQAGRTKPSPVAPSSPAASAPVATTHPVPAGNEVVHRVLPEVPESAQDTIQGTIRVSVRVQVDRSGNVAGSELDSAGPSKYFARLAMQAAQGWKFAPSQDDSRTFILRFEFTDSDTTAFATKSN